VTDLDLLQAIDESDLRRAQRRQPPFTSLRIAVRLQERSLPSSVVLRVGSPSREGRVEISMMSSHLLHRRVPAH
jgi:hypothetical protein